MRPAIWDGHKLCAINNSTKLLDAQDGSGEREKSGRDKMWVYVNPHLLGVRQLAQNSRKPMGVTQSQCLALETDPCSWSKPLTSSDPHSSVCRRKQRASDLQVPSNRPHCITIC